MGQQQRFTLSFMPTTAPERPKRWEQLLQDADVKGVTMIKLELDIAEVNGVLNALGQMPFVQVQALIVKIQGQAAPQVTKAETTE